MSLTCRVQYLNDVDPFAYASSYPEPPRPPVHTFSATLPLINQLAAVHRLLRAPHRVSVHLSRFVSGHSLLIHRLSRGIESEGELMLLSIA
ncbi:FH1/FH2 domain-containing protein 3 [Anthophora retusa]